MTTAQQLIDEVVESEKIKVAPEYHAETYYSEKDWEDNQ